MSADVTKARSHVTFAPKDTDEVVSILGVGKRLILIHVCVFGRLHGNKCEKRKAEIHLTVF